MTKPNLGEAYRMMIELAAEDVNVCKMARALRDAELNKDAAALARALRDIADTYKYA